jgi:hypothetical protein
LSRNMPANPRVRKGIDHFADPRVPAASCEKKITNNKFSIINSQFLRRYFSYALITFKIASPICSMSDSL